MTVIGALVTDQDFAVVWADTEIFRWDGTATGRHVNKVVVNVLASLVGTGSGWTDLGDAGDSVVLRAKDFDHALRELPGALRHAAIKIMRPNHPCPQDFIANTYLLCGFSAAYGRMLAARFSASSFFAPVLTVAALMPALEQPCRLDDENDLVELARRQMARLRTSLPEAGAGHLTIATLSAAGITVRTRRDFAADLLSQPPEENTMLIDGGYLALCTAVGAGTATEVTAAAYARQRVSFAIAPAQWSGEGAARAVTPRAVSSGFLFPYGSVLAGTTLAGRAIYDAPTAGNLIAVLPFGSGSRVAPFSGPVSQGDAGAIILEGPMFDAGYTGDVAAGTALGSCHDAQDVVGTRTPAADEIQGPAGYVQLVERGTATAGVALTLNRGTLQTAASFASVT